ncbi:MAG: DUF4335 domain-containing protein [Xenococcaceae cyanobacterium MO_234.B1]|nr:DUF4335 domain-containing protein [Xenococcaceae cyanobacterium MO_234.B1]
MNIRKQYSLPNCNLILEGMEDVSESESNSLNNQMTILINAECHFVGSNQYLSGGRVFLENLANTVSNYAQELLSGLPRPQSQPQEYPQIHLENIAENNIHLLTLEPEPNSETQPVTIDLTTVQLFDLVEAVDQFFADVTTLPDITLELESISKRHRPSEEPLVDRVIPFVAGTASLAIAAAIFWLIPPPPIQQPTESIPEPNPVEEVVPNEGEAVEE